MNLLPRVIYSTSTKFSGEIKVIEVGSVRRLVVGGLIQSVSPNYPHVENKVWGQLLKPPFPINSNPRVLMLGLGGGTTVHLASGLISPSQIKAVEVDPRIIEIAENFFDLSGVANLQVVNEDAHLYLSQKASEKFDFVVIDLYLGKDFSQNALKKTFYQKVKRVLTPQGVVSVNRIFNESDLPGRKEFFDLLNSVFTRVTERVLVGPAHVKNYLYYCQV